MSKEINKAYLKYFVTCDMTYIRSAIKLPKKKKKKKKERCLVVNQKQNNKTNK